MAQKVFSADPDPEGSENHSSELKIRIRILPQ
jgi:hypothetical protein